MSKPVFVEKTMDDIMEATLIQTSSPILNLSILHSRTGSHFGDLISLPTHKKVSDQPTKIKGVPYLGNN